jgi:kumamolisin
MPRFTSLNGSRRIPLPESRLAGPPDLSELATLTIRVRPARSLGGLDRFLKEQNSRKVADRRYLTHEELESEFGADSASLDHIERYASSQNLVVVRRSTAQRSIVVRGTLGDLIGAFPARVNLYHHPRGTYRGRSGEIQVPAELADVITGIFGFDTRPKMRMGLRHRLSSFSGPGGQNGVSPSFFAQRYNFPEEWQGVRLDGSGQTVAIIELGGGYRTSDLTTYFAEIGSPVPAVSFVSVDTMGNNPGTDDDGEVMLDIEVVGAVAPQAAIVVYFAPNQGDQGFIDAISSAVHDKERNIDVISISWGSPEPSTEQLDQQEINAYHELFQAAAALGITVCVATGDHGTADLNAFQWDGKIHVDHPACDDVVLACGGTQIDPTSGCDVVWNDGTPFDKMTQNGGGWASGGGISKCFSVPDYQQNAKLPVSIDGGGAGRGIPDIAMSATNYFVRVDSAEFASGGTSAVAPLTSALVTLLNQAKQKNVGFLNPFLYANANSGIVHDVTQGTNAIRDTVNGYIAGPGWDACTGLGTPDGTAILNLL